MLKTLLTSAALAVSLGSVVLAGNLPIQSRADTSDPADTAPEPARFATGDAAANDSDHRHSPIDKYKDMEWDSGFPVGPLFDEPTAPAR